MNKKMNHLVLGISGTLFLSMVGTIIGLTSYAKDQNLSFTAKANKEIYNLGEPIQVEFTVTNAGKIPTKVPREGVESGSLKIFVAKDGDEYKSYFGSGWGRSRGSSLSLEPNQSHSYYATILWNGRPRVSHLNESAAQEITKGKITTEYAFPDPGVYFIKGVSSIQENGEPVEFGPVKIVITEPLGADLEVWNQIKGNREIAFLMQKGAFDTSKEEQKQELVMRVEQILIQHPNSVYSSYLRPNLEKYKADELRRKQFLERSTIKPND